MRKLTCPAMGAAAVVLLNVLQLVQGTSLSVRAPVNPVEEGGILSIHCEVHNLERWHEVTMFRNVTSRTEKLSVNGDVLPAVGDRVFLAMRQMEGPSFVYFLSVIFATKEDTGEYFCKISDVAGQLTNLPVGSVFIETTFFPPITDPICSPQGPVTIIEGDAVTLTCTSEKASPVVQIRWRATGSESYLPSTDHIADGRVVSSITTQLTNSDSGVIFMCQITSSAYLDSIQTCHVGPVTVSDKRYSKPNNKPTTKRPPVMTGEDHIPVTTITKTACMDTCSSKPTTMLYWVLATIVTGMFALVMFVVVVVLSLKSRRADGEANSAPAATTYIAPNDGIYTELECRRIQNKVYLPIQNAIKHDIQ